MTLDTTSPEFALVRDAIANVKRITQAAATERLCRVSDQQFQKLQAAATVLLDFDVPLGNPPLSEWDPDLTG
jgi:hypothetical protein